MHAHVHTRVHANAYTYTRVHTSAAQLGFIAMERQHDHGSSYK